MVLENWLNLKDDKFLLANKKEIYLGIGIKQEIDFKDIDKYDNLIFIMKQFFQEDDLNIWSNFPSCGIIPNQIYKIKRPKNIEEYNFKTISYSMNKYNYKDWQSQFENVISKIKNKECEKIVLSREVKINLNETLSHKQIFYRLLKENPNSYIFMFQRNNNLFFGATPERLVSKKNEVISIDALAGTAVNNEENKKSLVLDKKNQKEHIIVVDNIVKKIKDMSFELKVENQKILELKNIIHLKTPIKAKSKQSLMDFINKLHPTPALGGEPSKLSVNYIKKFEIYPRGLYGAPIGYTENKDGLAVVGIRSGLLKDKTLHVFAGGGIVEDSICLDEYKETEKKLESILAVLK